VRRAPIQRKPVMAHRPTVVAFRGCNALSLIYMGNYSAISAFLTSFIE